MHAGIVSKSATLIALASVITAMAASTASAQVKQEFCKTELVTDGYEGTCVLAGFADRRSPVRAPAQMAWVEGMPAIEISWSSWTSAAGAGTGVWEYPGPDGYVDVPFRVRLDRPVTCPTGSVVFARLRVTTIRRADARRLPRAIRTYRPGACSQQDRL